MPTALTSTTNRSTARARNIVSCTGPCGSTPARIETTRSGSLRVRTGLGLSGAGLLVGLLLLVLGHGGVLVDVLLAGEPHDLVHDLVGDRAQDVAVVLHALVAAEVQRLPEVHHGARERPELL